MPWFTLCSIAMTTAKVHLDNEHEACFDGSTAYELQY